MEGLGDEVAADPISTGQRYRSQENVVCSDYHKKEGPKRSLLGRAKTLEKGYFLVWGQNCSLETKKAWASFNP